MRIDYFGGVGPAGVRYIPATSKYKLNFFSSSQILACRYLWDDLTVERDSNQR